MKKSRIHLDRSNKIEVTRFRHTHHSSSPHGHALRLTNPKHTNAQKIIRTIQVRTRQTTLTLIIIIPIKKPKHPREHNHHHNQQLRM